MSNFDFTEIAGRYERDSLAQKAAAEVLISMLEIGPREDVLDLCCGTGHLTERLSEITAGRVVGVDPAPGMVAQARSNYCSERISFEIAAAENLRANAEFDVIFCNSALQWFRDPARALIACKRALRPAGRIGPWQFPSGNWDPKQPPRSHVSEVPGFFVKLAMNMRISFAMPASSFRLPGSKRPARDTPPRKCLRYSNRGLQRDI